MAIIKMLTERIVQVTFPDDNGKHRVLQFVGSELANQTDKSFVVLDSNSGMWRNFHVEAVLSDSHNHWPAGPREEDQTIPVKQLLME